MYGVQNSQENFLCRLQAGFTESLIQYSSPHS